MPRLITFNSSNTVPGQYTNIYEYQLPSSQKFDMGDAVALASATFYYSVFNITSALGNNQLEIQWPTPTGTGYNNYIITLPDGMYSVDTINDYLQYYMINNGMYLIDANGDFVYYIEIISNFNFYGFQINAYPLPTSLPSGWSQPANWLNYSSLQLLPRIRLFSDININLGFTKASFPSFGWATTPQSLVSPNTPQITSQNTFLIRCSLVHNANASVLNDVIYAFSPNGEFGSLLSLDLDKYIYNSVKEGYYDKIRITLIDQNYQPLRLIDNNALFSLVIWKHSEDGDLK